MDDLNLEELRDLKAKLVKKACKLRDELKQQENKKKGRDFSIADLLGNLHDSPTDLEQLTAAQKDASKLCAASESSLGVKFKDVDKNWIRDNIYFYKAQVVSKALQFDIELAVDVEENKFTIQDLNCDFGDLDQCYLQEVGPWVKRFVRQKQFSYLISGISGYSDQSVLRSNILRTLQSTDYILLGKSKTKAGGIQIYVHPPGAEDRILFEFQWSINFVDRSWRLEHIFDIKAVEADETFIKANEDLLQGFCEVGLSRAKLEDLWTRLCRAIDDVETTKTNKK